LFGPGWDLLDGCHLLPLPVDYTNDSSIISTRENEKMVNANLIGYDILFEPNYEAHREVAIEK
jgi:hypothetical protein